MNDKRETSDLMKCRHLMKSEVAAELETVGVYHVKCYRQGKLLWEEEIENLVTTVGKNLILTSGAFTGLTLGLITGPGAGNTYVVGDTMASHAGWAEFTNYAEANRVPFVPAAAAAGNITSTASPAVFTINGAGGVVAGFFLTTVNTKSGTTGTLLSEGNFTTGDRTTIATDVLQATYSLTLT